MFLSPFKGTFKSLKGKKRPVAIRLPERQQLIDALQNTITTRKKNAMSLEIRIFMKNNRNLSVNWLREILDQRFDENLESSTLCLVYCFFIGRDDGISNYFERAIGKPGQRQQVSEKFIRFVHYKMQELIENSNNATILGLVTSIEQCTNYVWTKTTSCPLELFFHEQNQKSGCGWLLLLLCKTDRTGFTMQPEARYIVAVLFIILKGFCCKRIEILATAFGRTGSAKSIRESMRKLTIEVLLDHLDKTTISGSRNTSCDNATAPTASITAISSSVVPTIKTPRKPLTVSILQEGDIKSPLTSRTNQQEDNFSFSSMSTPKAARMSSKASHMLLARTPAHFATTPAAALSINEGMLDMSFGQEDEATPSNTASQSRVTKKVCILPTPAGTATKKQLFPPQTSASARNNSLVSPECDFLIESLRAAKNDEDFEKSVLNFVSSRADDDGVLLNKQLTNIWTIDKFLARTTERNRNIWLQSKTRSVLELIQKYITRNTGVREEERDIEKALLKKTIESEFGSIVYDDEVELSSITAAEMIVLRDRAGSNVSSVAMESICKNMNTMLQKKQKLKSKKSPFEGQLRKKMGRLEQAGAVPSTFEYVECQITKDDTSRCVYYYIENVPLLIERLVATCVLERQCEDSFDFSNFIDKIIMRFGADRGGGDIIMMISLANRKEGNTGLFSIPIRVVERATETYTNLEKTIYSAKSKAILEELGNQKLFMIRISFFKQQNNEVQNMKCMLVRFDGIERKEMAETKFGCLVEDDIINESVGFTFDSSAISRVNVDRISINENIFAESNGKRQLNLKIKLVQSEGEYVGCRIVAAKTNEDIFSFEFDSSVSTELTYASADCMHLIGIPCEDGKMCATVYGLSTCGSSYPCPKCLWALNDKKVSSWLKDYEQTVTENCIDYQQRTGEVCRKKCHERYKHLMGNSTDAPNINLKKSVYSVVHCPLMEYDDDLIRFNIVDPMHVSQGLMTHLTEETAVQLAAILSQEPGFLERYIQACSVFIQEMATLEKSDGYKKAKNLHNKEQRAVVAADKKLQKALKQDNEENILEAHEKCTEAIAKREEVDEEQKYIEMLNKINGAKELKALLQDLKKSKKKDFNKAVFLFMKAIKTFAGDFNKNHGQYELTNARGITALGKRQEILGMVLNGCGNNVNVTIIMTWWFECAGLLFQISIILKDQKKQDGESISKLKELVAKYVQLWMDCLSKYSDKNPIFWKLHMFLCTLIDFFDTSGMTGRCSAEGFENKHHVMNKLKRLMAPIAMDKLRCEKLSQRQQSCLISGVEEIHRFLDEEDAKASKGKRGHYASYGTRTKLLEDLPLTALVEDENDVDGFFVSKKKNFIPNDLREFYYYMFQGKVPDDWSKSFIESVHLGSKAASSAQYV